MVPVLAILEVPPAPRYTIGSVLRVAGIVTFFVAWGVLVYHAGLVLQAEWKLARLLEESNEFASLPGVYPGELEGVMRDKLESAGWTDAEMVVVPLDTLAQREFRVAAVKVAANEIFPAWSERLGLPLHQPVVASWRRSLPASGGKVPPDGGWGFEFLANKP
jgi:hypothetical protein